MGMCWNMLWPRPSGTGCQVQACVWVGGIQCHWLRSWMVTASTVWLLTSTVGGLLVGSPAAPPGSASRDQGGKQWRPGAWGMHTSGWGGPLIRAGSSDDWELEACTHLAGEAHWSSQEVVMTGSLRHAHIWLGRPAAGACVVAGAGCKHTQWWGTEPVARVRAKCGPIRQVVCSPRAAASSHRHVHSSGSWWWGSAWACAGTRLEGAGHKCASSRRGGSTSGA